jgi:sugar phosphate isomerase/epimerase
MARIRHSLQLAEALQAETLVVHLPNAVGIALLQLPTRRMPLPWKTPFNPVRAWIREQLAMTQRQTSVKIALENLPGRRIAGRRFNLTHWNTPAKWSAVHQWLTLDTTHWATLGVDPLAAYGAARKRVCHVHLSNYDGREHRLPHRGRLDLDLLLRTMAKDGYSGTMCLELHPDALEFQDGAACRRNLCDSVQFCREHLGQG